MVAIKVIRRDSLRTAIDEERVIREILILRHLNHRHISPLYEIVVLPNEVYIVIKYCQGGELFDYIVSHKRIKESEAKRLFAQLLSALEYCHARHVVHRDIKAENLLLDENRNLVVIDFGFTNTYARRDPLLDTYCGSPAYAAPELVRRHEYSAPEADIWSAGVTLYAMVCGCLPFDDADLRSLYAMIREGRYRAFPSYLSDSLKDLLQRFLTVDPRRRITIEAAWAHPWMDGMTAAHRHAVGRVDEDEATMYASIIQAAAVAVQRNWAPLESPVTPASATTASTSPPQSPRTHPRSRSGSLSGGSDAATPSQRRSLFDCPLGLNPDIFRHIVSEMHVDPRVIVKSIARRCPNRFSATYRLMAERQRRVGLHIAGTLPHHPLEWAGSVGIALRRLLGVGRRPGRRGVGISANNTGSAHSGAGTVVPAPHGGADAMAPKRLGSASDVTQVMRAEAQATARAQAAEAVQVPPPADGAAIASGAVAKVISVADAPPIGDLPPPDVCMHPMAGTLFQGSAMRPPPGCARGGRMALWAPSVVQHMAGVQSALPFSSSAVPTPPATPTPHVGAMPAAAGAAPTRRVDDVAIYGVQPDLRRILGMQPAPGPLQPHWHDNLSCAVRPARPAVLDSLQIAVPQQPLPMMDASALPQRLQPSPPPLAVTTPAPPGQAPPLVSPAPARRTSGPGAQRKSATSGGRDTEEHARAADDPAGNRVHSVRGRMGSIWHTVADALAGALRHIGRRGTDDGGGRAAKRRGSGADAAAQAPRAGARDRTGDGDAEGPEDNDDDEDWQQLPTVNGIFNCLTATNKGPREVLAAISRVLTAHNIPYRMTSKWCIRAQVYLPERIGDHMTQPGARELVFEMEVRCGVRDNGSFVSSAIGLCVAA